MAHVISKNELPHSGSAHKFEGFRYGGGADVSFFVSDTPPGKGLSLHTHPYAEVFVVQEGELTFTVGETTVGATVVRSSSRPPTPPQVRELGRAPSASHRHTHPRADEHRVVGGEITAGPASERCPWEAPEPSRNGSHLGKRQHAVLLVEA